MAILDSSFDKFLENIEPDKPAKNHAQEAHVPVREHLEEDDGFKDFFSDSFLYGSYKRHTAVGGIKDVDIVVLTNCDNTDPEHTPKKVLALLKRALNRYYKDAGSTEYQRKSIQVKDPLPDNPEVEMTLDIIPAIAINGEENALLVPDRELNEWVFSHPKGHISHVTTLNDEQHSGGMFVPLAKIVRYWWLFNSKKKHPKPKGFWIECLTGENFNQNNTTYAAHFITVLQNISTKYSNYETYTEPPSLTDPGMPQETLKTSMTVEEFKKFMECVNDSLMKAKKALEEPDEKKSSLLWRKVFGGLFPKVEQKNLVKASEGGMFVDLYPSEKEEFVEDYDVIIHEQNYRFKIECLVEQNGFRTKPIQQVSYFQRELKLVFKVVQSDINVPYRLMWKVKNTGEEAKWLSQLRGEITITKSHEVKIEHTRYRGTHYVECYAIDQNNICIAKDRVYVPIR